MSTDKMRQISLFEDQRLTLGNAIDLSIDSLVEYGRRYRHWAIAYSGGKDSTATATFVAWAIKSGSIRPPDSLTVLYADTRMELPPLHQGALSLLSHLQEDFETRVVIPPLDKRFFVYMLGRGVPPPHRGFRWCTEKLKIEAMLTYISSLADYRCQKLLTITGVRLGESAARDQRIALSCSKDSGECGQGWFQSVDGGTSYDTLAPLVHWRLCNVFDWLYFEQDQHGYDVSSIVKIYGDDDIRTGCMGCNLVDEDKPLKKVCRYPEWAHLAPLLELKGIYNKLRKPYNRLRKHQPEIRQDGRFGSKPGRLGPLTMAARKWGIEQVLDIQNRARVELISPVEHSRIIEMWDDNVWPQRWTGQEINGSVPVDDLSLMSNGNLAIQGLLIR